MDWSDLGSRGGYRGGRSSRRPRSSSIRGSYRGGRGGYESSSGGYRGGYKTVVRGGYGGGPVDGYSSSRSRGGLRGGRSYRGGGGGYGSSSYDYEGGMGGYTSHGGYEIVRSVSRGRSRGRGGYDSSYSSGGGYGGGRGGYKGGRGSYSDGGYDMGRGGYSSRGGGGGGGFRGGRGGIQKYTNDFSRGRGTPRGGRGYSSSTFISSRGIRSMSSIRRIRGGLRRGRGISRGAPGLVYVGQSSYRGSRGRLSTSKGPRKTPERDPCGLFISFGETINQDVAKELIEFAADAEEISFGLKCHLKYESEEKAMEMEETAEFEFTENKATINKAFREFIKKAEKRALNDEETSSSKKKRDVDKNGDKAEGIEDDDVEDADAENEVETEEPQDSNEDDEDDGDDV